MTRKTAAASSTRARYRSGDGRVTAREARCLPGSPHRGSASGRPRRRRRPGIRIEPPVSVPIDAMAMPVATAMAEPLLDPPALRSGAWGLRAVMPKADSSPVVPKRQLVQVALADDHGVRLAQARHDRRIGARHVVEQRPGGGGGRGRPSEIDQVLQCNRNALQRTAVLAVGQRIIDAARLRPRLRIVAPGRTRSARRSGRRWRRDSHSSSVAAVFRPARKRRTDSRQSSRNCHPQIIASSWNILVPARTAAGRTA